MYSTFMGTSGKGDQGSVRLIRTSDGKLAEAWPGNWPWTTEERRSGGGRLPRFSGRGDCVGGLAAVEAFAQCVKFGDAQGRDRVVEVVGADRAFVVRGVVLLPVAQGRE